MRQHSLERGRELQSGVVLKLPKAIIPAVYQVALLFILFVSSLPSIAANTESQTFSIREATIATALRKFAKQAQISVNYPRLSYRDGKTQLLGDYSVSEGLDKLLSGSRFTYKKVGQNSYVIVKKVKPHPKPADAVSANSITLPTITEITVTALKRSDELQKLPYSISAISNSSIQDQRLLGFTELSTQLSGVVFTQQGLGQNKILVRGLSDGIFSGSSQSLINTYLNGNRLTYSSGVPDIKLVDIEQIELLKGPQGTLYGSGAIAGLLNIVPRKPLFNSFELELTTSLSYTQHGDASNDVSAIINLPILKDKLAIRNALYIGDFGGYIDDIRLGMSDVNRSRVTTSRFAASYQLSSDWSMTGGVNYQAENRSDSDYYRVNLPRYSRDNHSKEPRRTTFQQYYLNVEAELSGLKLDANTSILTRIIDSEIDASRLLTEDISRFFDSVEEQMINQNLRLTEIIKQSTFTHELHLKNLSGSKTEWILGAFFSRTEDEYQSELYFPEGEPGMAIPLPDRINTTDRTQMVEELAAFGELTYHVNSSFSLAGGLRWFRSTNQARETFVDNISASFTHVSLGNNTQSGLLGKFVASYHRNNSVSYFQVSQGYRIGGPNLQTPDFFIEDGERIFAEEEFAAPFTSEGSFLDEKLTNYEIGHKVELIDQSLAINGAVFLAEWTNIQAFEFFSSVVFLYRPTCQMLTLLAVK